LQDIMYHETDLMSSIFNIELCDGPPRAAAPTGLRAYNPL